jgi:branched-chain amino acid transport system permease protein
MDAVIVGAIVSIATYSLIAVGFNLIFSVTKVFHFAHAVVYVLAGYVAYSVMSRSEFWVGSVVGVLAAAAVAALIEVAVYAQMRRRRASQFQILISSLGLQYLLLGVIGAVWGTYPLSMPNPLESRQPIHLAGFTFAWLDVATVVTALVLLAAFLLWLYRSSSGAECLAVADNPRMAEALGISLSRTRLIAMVAGTLLSAPAAILGGLYQSLTPGMGSTPLFIAFAAVLVGGVGRIPAALLGIAVLELIDSFVGYWLPGAWSLGVTMCVVLLFMLWRPRGLLSTAQRANAAVLSIASGA